MKRIVLTGCLVVFLAGCAASYRPVIDSKGVDMNKFEANLSECRQYAGQVAGPGTGVAVGAGIGAALGAAVAAAAGRGYDRGATARVGAVTGAAGGAAHGGDTEINVIRRCLQGRGYSVLN